MVCVDHHIRSRLVQGMTGQLWVHGGNARYRHFRQQLLAPMTKFQYLLAGFVQAVDHNAVRTGFGIDIRPFQCVLHALSGNEAFQSGKQQDLRCMGFGIR